MTKMCASIVMGAAVIVGAAHAGAADLHRGKGGLKDYGYAAPTPADSPARWYIRIDGGYAGHDDPLMVFNTGSAQHDGFDTNYDNTWTLGGGLGLYLSSNVRADVTVDHRFESDVTGRFTVSNAGTNHTIRTTNGLESTAVLANVYYDFDMRSRFTPYIGIGLGTVYHSVKRGGAADAFGQVTGVVDGKDNWHAAGALMAGFSVALRSNMHLDAGYRFLYLGETSTGDARLRFANGNREDGRDPTIEDVHAHELRVGLRYDIR